MCVFVLSKLLVASRMTHKLSPLSCPFEYLLPILNPYKYASVSVGVCMPSVCEVVIMKSEQSFTAPLWRNKSAVESVFTLRTNAK